MIISTTSGWCRAGPKNSKRILLLTGTCWAAVVIGIIVASANRMGSGREESNEGNCCKWNDRAFHFREEVW